MDFILSPFIGVFILIFFVLNVYIYVCVCIFYSDPIYSHIHMHIHRMHASYISCNKSAYIYFNFHVISHTHNAHLFTQIRTA